MCECLFVCVCVRPRCVALKPETQSHIRIQLIPRKSSPINPSNQRKPTFNDFQLFFSIHLLAATFCPIRLPVRSLLFTDIRAPWQWLPIAEFLDYSNGYVLRALTSRIFFFAVSSADAYILVTKHGDRNRLDTFLVYLN